MGQTYANGNQAEEGPVEIDGSPKAATQADSNEKPNQPFEQVAPRVIRAGGFTAFAEQEIGQWRQFDPLVECGHALLMVKREGLLAAPVAQKDRQHSNADAHHDGDDGNEKGNDWDCFMVHILDFGLRLLRFRLPVHPAVLILVTQAGAKLFQVSV